MLDIRITDRTMFTLVDKKLKNSLHIRTVGEATDCPLRIISTLDLLIKGGVSQKEYQRGVFAGLLSRLSET